MSSQSHLLPVSEAAEKFILPYPVEFKLEEKAFSLSGVAFEIMRVDTGEPYFKVKGNVFSLRDSKTLFNMNKVPIYKLSGSILTLRGRMHILDPVTNHPIMTLRKKGFIPGFGTGTIQAWNGPKDDGPPCLQIKGDVLRKSFSVMENESGTTLASIRRKSFNTKNIVLKKDTYIIRVEPGANTALLVFFVVAADEHFRDDGNRKGLL